MEIDIVAIHGLDTHSPKTWVAWKKEGDPGSGEVHWLKDDNMLPSIIKQARIFTYDWNANFDQDPSTTKLYGHSSTLLERLHIERQNNKDSSPIIFVASCFGGLLLVKALVQAAESHSKYQDILKSTVGIAFLGTPFQGTNDGFISAVQLRIAVALSMDDQASDELAKYLNTEELNEVVLQFCEMVQHKNFKFPITCFYETKRTDFTKAIKKLSPEYKKWLDSNRGILVSEHSACLQGFARSALEVRHAMLNKYPDRKNDAFKRVSFYLQTCAKDAREVLNNKGHLRAQELQAGATVGTGSNASESSLDNQNQLTSLGTREDPLSPQSMDLTPHNSSEARTEPNAPSAAAAHRISPAESTNPDQKMARRYPATYKYLEEQVATIKECEARIGKVKELLSLFSRADNSLGGNDPETAHKYFMDASYAFYTTRGKFESDNTSKREAIREQHYETYNGLAMCKLAILKQEDRQLSRDEKIRHLDIAKGYARTACEGQNHKNSKNCTCDALKRVKKFEKELH